MCLNIRKYSGYIFFFFGKVLIFIFLGSKNVIDFYVDIEKWKENLFSNIYFKRF